LATSAASSAALMVVTSFMPPLCGDTRHRVLQPQEG
jgi:hypothetical protein